MRRGFQLVEVTIALALAAGPLLFALNLVNANARGARELELRATARLVLVDLVELALGESAQTLREMARPGGEALLADRLARRTAHLPPAARAAYDAETAPFAGHLRVTLDEDVDGQPGLARLAVGVELPGGATVQVRRLLRMR